jgi:hypothetical protein
MIAAQRPLTEAAQDILIIPRYWGAVVGAGFVPVAGFFAAGVAGFAAVAPALEIVMWLILIGRNGLSLESRPWRAICFTNSIEASSH